MYHSFNVNNAAKFGIIAAIILELKETELARSLEEFISLMPYVAEEDLRNQLSNLRRKGVRV